MFFMKRALVLKPTATYVENADSSPRLWFGRPCPNPKGETSTIHFGLSRPGPLQLDIYDIAGRKVRALVDGSLDLGRHSIQWDGANNRGQKAGSGDPPPPLAIDRPDVFGFLLI